MPYRLQLRFEDPDRFREELERSLAMGGAFVPTPDPVQLRTLVELQVELAWADARIPLEAQVVHTVPLERALKPLEAGVIVAFVAPAEELRETLGPHLERGDGERVTDAAGAEGDAAPSPSAADPGEDALGPATTFSVRVQRIDSESLDVLEASVIELATAGIPVGRMLEVIPEADADVLGVIQTLLGQGILTRP